MPDRQLHSLVSFKLKTGGEEIPTSDQFEILDIQVSKQVNKIGFAQVKIKDGSVSKENFAASSSSNFEPGKSIEIQAGFGLKTEPVFKGLIISQSIQAIPEQGMYLTLDCRDESIKLTSSNQTDVFLKSTDSAAIESIVGKYGLDKDISSTENEYPQIVQYNATDWDFILSRAEVNGMIVMANDNKLSVTKPKTEGSGAVELTFGNNIVQFSSKMDARSQYSKVNAQAWNYQEQEVSTGKATSVSTPEEGNMSGEDLSKVSNSDPQQLVTTAPLSAEMLKGWAEAELLKSRLAKIRGEVKAYGQSSFAPNQLITLKGLGDRFDGTAYISGVRHEISKGNWWSYLEIGLSDTWFAKEYPITAPPNSGLLPGIRGLLNGIVKQITEDPLNQNRILVTIPVFKDGETEKNVWARWTQPYASKEFGQFFMPEIGDEVILGFLNEDPRYPIILGSVYSSKQTPPLQPADENPKKTIVTKSKLTLEFDDQNKVITISTPSNNQIVLSEKEGEEGITISDQNENKVTLNKEGISINSPKTISINAEESVTISGTAGVTVSSEADITLNAESSLMQSAPDVVINAETGMSVMGGSATSVVSEGDLVLTGAMIMIN